MIHDTTPIVRSTTTTKIPQNFAILITSGNWVNIPNEKSRQIDFIIICSLIPVVANKAYNNAFPFFVRGKKKQHVQFLLFGFFPL